jgi:hypothetical protein
VIEPKRLIIAKKTKLAEDRNKDLFVYLIIQWLLERFAVLVVSKAVRKV